MTFLSIVGLIGIISEAAAAVVQVVYPGNQGVAGILAGIIKVTQALGQPSQDVKKD